MLQLLQPHLLRIALLCMISLPSPVVAALDPDAVVPGASEVVASAQPLGGPAVASGPATAVVAGGTYEALVSWPPQGLAAADAAERIHGPSAAAGQTKGGKGKGFGKGILMPSMVYSPWYWQRRSEVFTPWHLRHSRQLTDEADEGSSEERHTEPEGEPVREPEEEP